jgi:integrase/recombinase XerD
MDEITRHASEHGYRIEEAVLNGNAGYRLCGGHRVFGERVRIFRATPDKRSMSRVRRDLYDEARRLIEQHVGRVDKAHQLSASQRVDVGRAYELLEESGRRVPLTEAVRFFLKYNPAKQECTNRHAIVRFLETKGVSEEEFNNTHRGFRREKARRARVFQDHTIRHRTSLTSLLRKFAADWGEEKVGIMAAKRSELKDWLDTKISNTTTRNNYRRALHNFYGWALEKGLLAENPARPWKQSKTSAARARASAPIGILSPAQMQSYLKGAAELAPALLPYFVVCGFSGIRTDEIDRLQWKDIKMRNTEIDVQSGISKTGARRIIRIHPTLQAWLSVVERGHEGDRVVPSTFQAMRRRLRKTLNRERKTKLPWPANALRHSFGTYRYKETLSLEKTSDEMGHQDPKVFRHHYLNPDVTSEAATEYWSLVPSKVLGLDPPKKKKAKTEQTRTGSCKKSAKRRKK